MTVYQICIPHTHFDFFDYEGAGLEPALGARVWVPFRQQTRVGIVVGKVSANHSSHELKKILSVIDEEALLPLELLNLCRWISDYYHASLSEVIVLALPKKYREGKPVERPTTQVYQLTMPVEEARMQLSKRRGRQHELLECIAEESVTRQMIQQLGFKSNQLKALCELGLIEMIETSTPQHATALLSPPLPLNAEQMHAVSTISTHLDRYQCFLLQGVTGSGKTEVYLQVIAKVLSEDKQVLVIVPEIGLTPQLLARFTARFHEKMVVIHSHLSDKDRQYAWQLALDEVAKLIIGTRAAIFTPLPKLGLIIIDEEHDTSLKQMDGVRYSARDTALIRAQTNHIPIVLGSATPSLESLHNSQILKYQRLILNEKALESPPLHYQVLDIRSQSLEQGLADVTLRTIEKHLAEGHQVLVFINRRGFAPVLLCHSCGWMADCRACDSHLTLHKQKNRLICHHCEFSIPPPLKCPKCHHAELLPIGTGTQRVYEFLNERFPEAKALRVDRDETKKKHALDKHLACIETLQTQLIVGTQMLAKGHHFPRLTLVVVLDIDQGLYHHDFRAIERMGQLLTQVAGRAGRAEYPGEVLIQTHAPDHPLLNVLIQEGYEAFADAILAIRQQAALPPYHYLIVLRAHGKNFSSVTHFLQQVKLWLQPFGLIILGPAPAPLARKAQNYRMQLFVKSSSRKYLHSVIKEMKEWIVKAKIGQKVQWNMDVDPVDLA